MTWRRKNNKLWSFCFHSVNMEWTSTKINGYKKRKININLHLGNVIFLNIIKIMCTWKSKLSQCSSPNWIFHFVHEIQTYRVTFPDIIHFIPLLFNSFPFHFVSFFLLFPFIFYSILFYSILFYSILFYSILFYSILFYIYLRFLYSILVCSALSLFNSIQWFYFPWYDYM